MKRDDGRGRCPGYLPWPVLPLLYVTGLRALPRQTAVLLTDDAITTLGCLRGIDPEKSYLQVCSIVRYDLDCVPI